MATTQRVSGVLDDPHHEMLRAALRDALFDVARRSGDPVGYLHSAREELLEAFMKLRLPDGSPDREATCEQISEAFTAVWPEVIAKFNN